MSIDPYVDIDADYSRAVQTAIVAHEKAIADANARLSTVLAMTDDPVEIQEIFSAFDLEIQPERDAYHAALKEADDMRELKKSKSKDAYVKHTES